MQGWLRAREVTVSVKQGTEEQTTLSRLTTHDLTSFCWKERKTTCRIKRFLQQNVCARMCMCVCNTFLSPRIPS